MKKITTLLASIILCSLSFSQTNKLLESVTKNYLTGKVEAAKQEVDKLMSSSSTASDPEILIWSLTLDAEVINDATLSVKYPNLINGWLDKFKTYEKADPNLTQITSPAINWKPLGLMYDKFYNDGRIAYSNQKWNDAYESFDQCAYLAKIIMKKDLRKNGGAMDTLAILMAGYSAQNAQKVKDAVKYYSFAADQKYGGANDLDMYKYLLIGFIELKDKAGFDKYLALTKEKYPKEDFEDYSIEFISKNMNIDEKLEYFNTEDAKGTLTGSAYTTLGDAFVSYRKVDAESEKGKLVHAKAIEAFQKAFNKNNNALAAYNAAILLYNNFSDLDDIYRENVRNMQSINSNKPVEKDPKKRAAVEAKAKAEIEPIKKANAELEVKIIDAADKAIEWLEKTEKTLKEKADKNKVEATSYKNTVKNLGQLYEYKREKVKAKDPKAYDAFDAKSKLYFGIFDKL
jgi:hypothetical protein